MKDTIAIYHDDNLRYPKDPFDAASIIRNGIDYILSELTGERIDREWNPLGKLVSKGSKIIIKPNFVTIKDHHFELNSDRQLAVTTNNSLIVPIIEYAYKAVGDNGKIIIADSPIEASDFDKTVSKLGVLHIVEEFQKRGYPVELVDLRDFRVKPIQIINNLRLGNRSFNLGLFIKKSLPGDNSGYSTIDLLEKSAFNNHKGINKLRFYKPHYKKPLEAHFDNHHKYNLANSILEADLIINLPKMKTHKISGVTLALKNLIGLTNKKYWLPHYTEGYMSSGDQYDHEPKMSERIQNFLRVIPIGFGNSIFIRYPITIEESQQVQMPIYNGSWIKNDTLWRTILDVAKVVEYSDKTGNLAETKQRKVLSIIDGVIAGEGNGPLGATAKYCNVLLGSMNMYHLDFLATKMMGFNTHKIKYLKDIQERDINYTCNQSKLPGFKFVTPERWAGLYEK